MSDQIDVNVIIDQSGKYRVPPYIDDPCISRYLNFAGRPHRRDNAVFINNDTVRNWGNLIAIDHLSSNQGDRSIGEELRGGRLERGRKELQ